MKIIEFDTDAIEFTGVCLIDEVYHETHYLGNRRYVVHDDCPDRLRAAGVPFKLVEGQE